jgi:hypothetical protein
MKPGTGAHCAMLKRFDIVSTFIQIYGKADPITAIAISLQCRSRFKAVVFTIANGTFT